MDRIAFAQHLDNAIKYLPAARKILEQGKAWGANEEKYFNGLSHVAKTILGKATSTAIEIAAAQLLLELADYKLYDPNSSELKEFDPQELRDLSIRKITAAADRLAEITGRAISDDGLIPTDTPAAKVEIINPSVDSNKLINTENLVYWRVILYSNIKQIDAVKKASVRAVIKYLRGLNDERLPNKGNADELFWIDDMVTEQRVVKKTVSSAVSIARKLP